MRRYIPTEFVSRTVQAAQHRGIDLQPALSDSGINPESLSNPATQLSPDDATNFTRAVWAITDDELGGLGAAPVPRGTFRLVCLALIHSPDLNHALKRMISSLPALPAMTPLTLNYDPTTGTVTLGLRGHRPDEVTQLLIELAFLLIHRFAAWLISQPLTPTEVTLPYPPRGDYAPAFYRGLFGAHTTFNGTSARIAFPTQALSTPVVQTEDTLREFLRLSPALLFKQFEAQTPRTTQVERILQRSKLNQLPTNAHIAEKLSVSESHLRRQLRAEGTSINELRDNLLCERAIELLRRGDPVDHIATTLGFSESSAFRRAFKRWTGTTPASFRNPE
ncbi:AraC family transcriptional regulator ligand-binding domain-containing protein [Hoyosella rhizosphaerae]|uniref:Transcriptional regulator n=1 Tax=Hoyosella rhizosphaerae TaxID=1755582 RepID=A0A916XHB0_9ACTN|nr:AraC family transcriptional regulator [Hoyosella rhizosphaerae]MBN4928219.1 AraC family transcriptional regulator ligand-binding domain-containing protein [Hoyosella rhizosphaerae]GGC73320.1 transcriptional regulator [Hoyosella rhizosphaerae]